MQARVESQAHSLVALSCCNAAPPMAARLRCDGDPSTRVLRSRELCPRVSAVLHYAAVMDADAEPAVEISSSAILRVYPAQRMYI